MYLSKGASRFALGLVGRDIHGKCFMLPKASPINRFAGISS
jgi:hypothetical protein